MDIMYGLAEESMKIGVPVILENNFDNSSKPKLIEMIKKYNYHVINIRFEGEISQIYNRFIKRDLSEERHLGHVTNQCYPPIEPIKRVTTLNLEDFKDMVINRGINGFDIGGELISVDSTDLNLVNYSEILSKVRVKIKEISF